MKTARKALELTDRKRVIAAFVHLVHTTESRTVLRLAAEKLGKLDPGNKSNQLNNKRKTLIFLRVPLRFP